MTRALIIGAGIAGPATAMALQRVGITATVYEAHPRTGAEVGSYLTVTPTAWPRCAPSMPTSRRGGRLPPART